MKFRSGFLFFFFIENVFCFYKRWLPNTNFDSDLNWNTGRIPCGNDQVIIPDDSPTIMLSSNATIGKLVLPSNGVLVLGMNNILSFSSSSSDQPNCKNSGKNAEFNATYAREWVDPANWCLVNSIDGPCVKDVPLLDSEKVPCPSDDVIFPPGNSYFIDFGTDMDLTINSMRFLGKTYSTNSFESFISEKGKSYFRSYHSDESPANLNIRRRPCRDPASCECGNYKPPIFRKICDMHSPFCKRPQCKQPVRPTGHCCNICGAVIKSKFENGFNYESFVKKVKQEFLQNQTGIELVVSRIDTLIQLTLTDPAGERSGDVALKIVEDIKKDIKSGSHKYVFSEVEIKISGVAQSKISTLPPLTFSSPLTTITTTTKTGTSVITTSQVVKEQTTKDHLRSINSSSSSSSSTSTGSSRLTDIGILEIILGGLALQVLIILIFILYKKGKISSFVDHVRRNQIVVNLHKRFANQDSVQMEDLPNTTLDNDDGAGFQNPMYGVRTRQTGKLNYLTNDSEIGEASNERCFDNPLFGSNQDNLYEDASKISPALTMNPVYDPNELQDSTI